MASPARTRRTSRWKSRPRRATPISIPRRPRPSRWARSSPIRSACSGLTATIDAYQIHINDTIARLSSFTAYYNCLNANGTSNPTYDFNNTYCQLIDRNGTTGDRENVDSLFLNLGKVRTRGIDVSVGWRGDVGPGTLTAGTAINYLLQYKYQPDSTAPFRDAKGTLDQGGQYDYRALTTVGYSMGAFDVGLQWRFLPGIDAADKALLPNTTVGGAGRLQPCST